MGKFTVLLYIVFFATVNADANVDIDSQVLLNELKNRLAEFKTYRAEQMKEINTLYLREGGSLIDFTQTWTKQLEHDLKVTNDSLKRIFKEPKVSECVHFIDNMESMYKALISDIQRCPKEQIASANIYLRQITINAENETKIFKKIIRKLETCRGNRCRKYDRSYLERANVLIPKFKQFFTEYKARLTDTGELDKCIQSTRHEFITPETTFYVDAFKQCMCDATNKIF